MIFKVILEFPLWLGVDDPACLWRCQVIPSPVQWVKDLVLLKLRCSSQLRLTFSPWPRVQSKKKKKKTHTKKVTLQLQRVQRREDESSSRRAIRPH